MMESDYSKPIDGKDTTLVTLYNFAFRGWFIFYFCQNCQVANGLMGNHNEHFSSGDKYL